MNQHTIKVIKKDLVKKVKVIIAIPEIANEIHLNTVDVINNWISERRENNRLEKVFSAASILAWKSPHPQF
jgi:hypothetical protein